jgi:hypothetical protein
MVLAAELASFKDPAPPGITIPAWEGFYLGGHAGGQRGAGHVKDTFDYQGDPTVIGNLVRGGFIGGMQAGYNFQRGHFVFGPEAEAGYLGISASKSFYQPGSDAACQVLYPGDQWPTAYGAWNCNIGGKYSISSDFYASLTGRLGYQMDRTLLYLKGGGRFAC